MRGEGGGGQWNRHIEDAGRRRGWRGSCFTAAVSLLLREGILMRSVNECWHI